MPNKEEIDAILAEFGPNGKHAAQPAECQEAMRSLANKVQEAHDHAYRSRLRDEFAMAALTGSVCQSQRGTEQPE